MKLYLFGHSASLPYELSEPDGFWGAQLAKKLSCSAVINFSAAAADNLWIYHSLLRNHHLITRDDIVIVGWSHPNRKSFVMEGVLSHEIAQASIIYPGDPVFFRSAGSPIDNHAKYAKMTPTNSGVAFYDDWFNRYYSRREADINFIAYTDSARHMISGRYLPFYFSRESVDGLSVEGFFWLDWILQTRCWISEDNLHPNEQGHQQLADVFYHLMIDEIPYA